MGQDFLNRQYALSNKSFFVINVANKKGQDFWDSQYNFCPVLAATATPPPTSSTCRGRAPARAGTGTATPTLSEDSGKFYTSRTVCPISLDPIHIAAWHSTLNVEPKFLTSPRCMVLVLDGNSEKLLTCEHKLF